MLAGEKTDQINSKVNGQNIMPRNGETKFSQLYLGAITCKKNREKAIRALSL